ncbi:Ankyrin repeat and SOCS box protein 10 [Penaeus vannamei]|uniref:Ankyrin repeat and SOCS box protein 10 n=1 Tax=Penaeus vannamei TaxID=6689 RepID=A0A423U1F3_PENVA|nr:Ankyrin repeat and SOCS box protein 10 [Penaeus vannamei]
MNNQVDSAHYILRSQSVHARRGTCRKRTQAMASLRLILCAAFAVVLLVSIGCGERQMTFERQGQADTALHCAAEEGHEAAAKKLIVKGADVNAKDKDGYTPLHLTAGNGHRAMVEMLIGKGAEPNAKADGGDTALHIAASQGHLHVLFTLVKLGAATKVKNGQGMTPKELLKGTSTTANYDMEIFKGISLIEIMEKYLAAEKGKASLRRENMSLQNKHKKELKSIKEDQRKRDADSQKMKKEIGALKDKIKAIEEEHKAELRNVAENQQEKEAEILRMQNEIVGLKETVASRDEKIKSLEVR